MKTICKSILAALLLAMPAMPGTTVMAQETTMNSNELKYPTLEDLIPGGETYRFAETLYGVQWWGDQCIKPTLDSLFAINPKNGKETLLTTREHINQALQAQKLGKLSHLYSVQLPWADKTQLLLAMKGKYVVYDWKADQIVSSLVFDQQAANADYSTESGHVAYTIANNLYVDNHQVTDEPEGVVCGQTVHRNEFGISKGTFWSPSGQLLAFYRMDESMVSQYPLVDITARVGKVDPVRYPMAGMTSHKVQVGIYNPATGKTLYLNTGDPTDRYFTNISWAPDEKSLFLIELNRDQNHSKLCQYDAETGKLMDTLYQEKHPKYVEPQQPIVFLPWDDTKFIYQSQKDGYNHLYLFDTQIKTEVQRVEDKAGGNHIAFYQMKPLTSGPWLVQSILGFNAKKKEIFITATKESPLQSNLYKVNVANGKLTPMDNGQGVHNAQLSASGTYLLDNWSAPDVPRVIDLRSTANGRQTACLLTAANPFEGFKMPSVEVGTLKAADGKTDLYYRIIKPADFDPAKNIPPSSTSTADRTHR